jgi:hypothetical protein
MVIPSCADPASILRIFSTPPPEVLGVIRMVFEVSLMYFAKGAPVIYIVPVTPPKDIWSCVWANAPALGKRKRKNTIHNTILFK